ncbi:MAG TPA: aldehyde dehydrogenase family protein [Vicinamibacterales bacterium]|jgi:acetaldehyde dehydrogenase (acetylating)|nr:aldehyde dehydrogenase family protein [Vicinamibacterales bacterium]
MAQTDRDLASIAEARSLARRAKMAAPVLAEFSQERIDSIVDAMAAAATAEAEALARLAHEETSFGVVRDKVLKNLFASEKIYKFIRPMKTVGVVARLEDRKVVEIAEPFGVVAAIVPSTNPTSTAIYKVLIALKARCPIVLSPHPSAVRCITRVAELMNDAARRAGAPDGAINWMTTVSLEGTQELMKAREVAVILATGGMGLVRAAYSAGKPAYGVGPGNAPAYIERSADVVKAARDIVTGKTFDNGLLCSSENSVVVDAPIAEEAKRELAKNGAYFMSPAEADSLAKVLVTPQRLPNPSLVGRPATYVAQQAGISAPPETRVLIAELKGVGRDYPLSIEKLCPVLSFYIVADWQEGCERCKEILRYGGMGHTMSVHSRNDDVILQFGLKKPAFRIVVNSPSTIGSIGLTTGLDPSMTLGCGGWGGNITSDNISPKHLINIKRLAYETMTAAAAAASLQPSTPSAATAGVSSSAGATKTDVGSGPDSRQDLPKAPRAIPAAGISADVLARRIDEFLTSKGYRAPGANSVASVRTESVVSAGGTPPADTSRPTTPIVEKPAEFVCEEDVRQALRQGRKIVIGERTIVTPAARDLAEQHRLLVQAAWPQ